MKLVRAHDTAKAHSQHHVTVRTSIIPGRVIFDFQKFGGGTERASMFRIIADIKDAHAILATLIKQEEDKQAKDRLAKARVASIPTPLHA
jgi:hypothetical protein